MVYVKMMSFSEEVKPSLSCIQRPNCDSGPADDDAESKAAISQTSTIASPPISAHTSRRVMTGPASDSNAAGRRAAVDISSVGLQIDD